MANSIIDIKKFDEYITAGFLRKQKHPSEELFIWNYTEKCQFGGMWDEITLMSRGLITDGVGNIVARPFLKFFNVGENGQTFPVGTSFIATDKLDGSLGISYWQNGKMFIATRGSFTSEQSIVANEILHEKYNGGILCDPSFTYLFEIIYPQNRIVVNYDDKKDLILIGCINTKTGEEISLNFVKNFENFPIVKEFSKEEIDVRGEPDNSEGYVYYFPRTGLRLKFKFSEYKRLHKLMSHLSDRSIWEVLSENGNIESILSNVPDEMFQWIRTRTEQFRKQYENIEYCSRMVYEKVKGMASRKEQANYIIKIQPVMSDTKDYNPGVVFSMLDGKDYSKGIWKLLYPVEIGKYMFSEQA